MSRHVLVVNAGSSSLKYQLVDPDTGVSYAKGLVERIGDEGTDIRHVAGGNQKVERAVDALDHSGAIVAMEQAMSETGVSLDNILAIGHRVVHGGRDLTCPTVITPRVVEEIDRVSFLAPLHNPAALKGIRSSLKAFPNVPQVAVFDTAFFADLPNAAAAYAIDRVLAKRHAIRRYGFHGTSHQFVAGATAQFLGRDLGELNQIVLHLGNGASASAIAGGHPLDTSMGMTPLEGLVMGTRSGDLDPGVLVDLERAEGMDTTAADEFLNRRSGILGMCGHADFRDMEEAMNAGDADSRLAFEVYVHRLVKYIGAYAMVLGRLDALVFTAGVGENSSTLRAAVCEKLQLLGVCLDEELNSVRSKDARRICSADSKVEVLVVPTNEEWAIARHAAHSVAELERANRHKAAGQALSRS